MAETPIPTSFIRTNPLNERERTVATYLRQQHLPGVDTDDEAAVALEIEQARLLLIGVAGVMFFSITQLLTLERPVCATPLAGALPFLVIALLGSWLSLLDGAKLRAARVKRRYDMYDADRIHCLVALRAGVDPDPEMMNDEWDRIRKGEDTLRARHRKYRRIDVWFAAAGISCALWSAIGTTLPNLCPAALQDTGRKASPDQVRLINATVASAR